MSELWCQYPPDNLLVVCAHCGDRYPSKELKDSSYYSIDERINGAVEKRMENDEQMKSKDIQMGSAEGVYVPIFDSLSPLLSTGMTNM